MARKAVGNCSWATSPTPPGLGFEQGRPVQPGRQAIVAGELPGFAGQGAKHVLGELLGSTRIFHLPQGGSINQLEMPAHQDRERRLIPAPGELL